MPVEYRRVHNFPENRFACRDWIEGVTWWRNGLRKINEITSAYLNKNWLVSLLVLTGVGLLLSSIFITADSQPVSRKSPAVVSNVADFFAEFPMRFHTNEGEFDNGVKYFSKGYQFDLLFTYSEVLLNLYSREDGQKSEADSISQVGIKFLERDGIPVIVGNRPASTNGNVSVNERADTLIDNEPGFLELMYKNVYPGVDVYFYGKQKQLFYEFVLSEGADTGVVRLKIVNIGEDARVNVDIHGNVAIACEGKRMKINKPTVYRIVDNQKMPVSGYFFVTRNNELRFKEVGQS